MLATRLSTILAEKGNAVYTVASGATVLEAVREMNEKGIGALLVVDGNAPVGIFTERDVLRRIVDSGVDARTTRVTDVMTRDLHVVNSETTIEEAMTVMTHRRFRHLPVVDGATLIGLVSIGDLTRWMVRTQEHEIQHLTNYIQGGPPA